MSYFLYSVFLISIVCGTAIYLTRHHWLPYLPDRVQEIAYSRLPTSFMGDVEAGFTSADFDLTDNVMEGDSRQGLDQKAKREVQHIMKRNNVGFDEARRIHMQQNFKKSGIGADGLPRDPKLVTFS